MKIDLNYQVDSINVGVIFGFNNHNSHYLAKNYLPGTS